LKNRVINQGVVSRRLNIFIKKVVVDSSTYGTHDVVILALCVNTMEGNFKISKNYIRII
jgi:hypothetical protein